MLLHCYMAIEKRRILEESNKKRTEHICPHCCKHRFARSSAVLSKALSCQVEVSPSNILTFRAPILGVGQKPGKEEGVQRFRASEAQSRFGPHESSRPSL